MSAEKINVAYYRVSTVRQGRSGLGLDAQKDFIVNFLRKKPDYEFVDIQTGKNENRVEFQKSLDLCLKLGARLVIAKLDRMSRNVHFISGLMQSKIDFICCDNPNATPILLHIMAAFAEHEAKIISERTKAALRAKKEREILSGVITFKLGTKNSPFANSFVSKNEGVPTGLQRRQNLRNALIEKNSDYQDALDVIKNSKGSLVSIAKKLNQMLLTTINGGTWTAIQVSRELKR